MCSKELSHLDGYFEHPLHNFELNYRRKINNFTTKIFAHLDLWRLSRRCTLDTDKLLHLI